MLSVGSLFSRQRGGRKEVLLMLASLSKGGVEQGLQGSQEYYFSALSSTQKKHRNNGRKFSYQNPRTLKSRIIS